MSSSELPVAALPVGAFAGLTAFAQLVRDALACAAHEGWDSMVWSDPDFQDWPLREASVVQALQAWSARGRRLVLLAQQYDDLRRLHPRFVTWRTRWDHIVDCRVCRQGEALPSALWTPRWTLQRLDAVRCSGVCGDDPQRRLALREQLQEYLRQSAPGFSATTMGL